MDNKENIQIILEAARQGINWDAVLSYVIAEAPEVVVNAIYQSIEGSWGARVKIFAMSNDKVQTIKYCRRLSGLGLKEAKTWVELHCERFMI